jgi:hypothetical protein
MEDEDPYLTKLHQVVQRDLLNNPWRNESDQLFYWYNNYSRNSRSKVKLTFEEFTEVFILPLPASVPAPAQQSISDAQLTSLMDEMNVRLKAEYERGYRTGYEYSFRQYESGFPYDDTPIGY